MSGVAAADHIGDGASAENQDDNTTSVKPLPCFLPLTRASRCGAHYSITDTRAFNTYGVSSLTRGSGCRKVPPPTDSQSRCFLVVATQVLPAGEARPQNERHCKGPSQTVYTRRLRYLQLGPAVITPRIALFCPHQREFIVLQGPLAGDTQDVSVGVEWLIKGIVPAELAKTVSTASGNQIRSERIG